MIDLLTIATFTLGPLAIIIILGTIFFMFYNLSVGLHIYDDKNKGWKYHTGSALLDMLMIAAASSGLILMMEYSVR